MAPGVPPCAVFSAADYQAYLKAWLAAEHAVNSTMTDEAVGEFYAAIDNGEFYSMPGDMLFQDTFWGYSAATYDEFVAAGGQVQIPAFDPTLVADAEP